MKRTLSKPDPYEIPVGRESDRQHREHDRLLVATTVRMARAALGWSQAEFGRFLGMSQRAIHRIEQGHSEPRRKTLLAIESSVAKSRFQDRRPQRWRFLAGRARDDAGRIRATGRCRRAEPC